MNFFKAKHVFPARFIVWQNARLDHSPHGFRTIPKYGSDFGNAKVLSFNFSAVRCHGGTAGIETYFPRKILVLAMSFVPFLFLLNDYVSSNGFAFQYADPRKV